MGYEHNNTRPTNIQENWEGKWKVFSWMEFVCAIPHVLFLVTTLKENGLPNAAFQSWSSFSGEGDEYFVLMSGVMKHTHTYANIRRDKEFCINFLDTRYLQHCWKSIHDHHVDADEIARAGLTQEASRAIKVPRVAESFLKMECAWNWEKELLPKSHNITICGRVLHIAMDEAFATAPTKDRYGKERFMFNLPNPINPFTGEHLGMGVGTIRYTCDM